MPSFLENLFGLNQGEPLIDAANKNTGLINKLDQTGTGYLNQAKGITGDYLDLGKLGAGLYADSLGVNGAAGAARAKDAFQTGPGYQFSLDQGLQALERNASKYGRSDSGNTDLDLMRYATGYADQAFGNWQNQLSGYNGMYGQGVGAATKSLGDLTQFKEGITQGLVDTTNQRAQGEATNNAGWGNLLGNIGKIVGGFSGYGGF